MTRNNLSLSQVLHDWRAENLTKMSVSEHLPIDRLNELALSSADSGSDRDAWEHLIRCESCSDRLQGLLDDMQEVEAWDVGLSKAAATKQEGAISIRTEGGKYTISLRRSLSGSPDGLITVEVDPAFSEKLEGKDIIVKDHKKRVLLQGEIVCGKVSQRIDRIDDIDISRLVLKSVG